MLCLLKQELFWLAETWVSEPMIDRAVMSDCNDWQVRAHMERINSKM